MTHRDRVGVIDLELGRLVLVGVHARGEEVHEGLEDAQVLSCHVGDLEDWTYPEHTHTQQMTTTKLKYILSYVCKYVHV